MQRTLIDRSPMLRTLHEFCPALAAALVLLCPLAALTAEIQRPADAPIPLSPEESAKRVKLPPGFRLDLIASEPLIREPAGVCWDERGRLFVCELHGYNLEGQYDIDELNKTGQLDRQVRRIQAIPQAQQAARTGTYGTIKLLTDTDGDGRMDKAEIFADGLPPCYGICPARGGLIVACAPHIIFLADRDGDGRAELRVTLFTGFATGALERGINCPQWGLDDWIYFGRGHGGGFITGPHLREPVRLGGTDFRIKADGSAIEPITGSTHTFGHAFTENGERFTATTSVPGLYVTPLLWRYLARNPDAAAPRSEQSAGDYTRVVPTAAPHPWRTKRAQDPGFFKYYRDRYGAGDSDADGWFTSACGLLVYQDTALPAEYRGQLFVCEPAQNLIHRAVIERDGPALRLRRAPGEESSEFLASNDSWFHPIHLAHGPDGAIWIVDLYREIIEDYSAIPRYLQQQYGLTNGINHGRLWRLAHRDAPRTPSPKMNSISLEALAEEIASPHFWRRQTARRLLVERNGKSVAPAISRIARAAEEPASVLNALHTLDALGALTPDDAVGALKHQDSGVRIHGLRLGERWLDSERELFALTMDFANATDSPLLLQLALSLGESQSPRSVAALALLARKHGDVKWIPNAILSSLHRRAGALLAELLRAPGQLGHGALLLEPLAASIGARREETEMTEAVVAVAKSGDAALQAACLKGFGSSLVNRRNLAIGPSGLEALKKLARSDSAEVRVPAVALLRMADPAQRQVLLAQAARDAGNMTLAPEARLAAISQLASSDTPGAAADLVAAWPPNTPKAREAILEAIFSRREWLEPLLDALERKTISAAVLSAFQRVTLLENDRVDIRERAVKLLAKPSGANDETFRRFSTALANPRDLAHGELVFRENCATCHQARGQGFAVGPDLGAEFQRAEEAILKDILAPSETISAGFPTYVVETGAGQSFNGVLASESATSVILRQAAGFEQTVLRKDIARVFSLPVSLMPETLSQTLQPQDVADVIAWLRDASASASLAPDRVVLFDEEPEFIGKLRDGEGAAKLETNQPFSGRFCLTVAPPQRHAARIADWNYRITEKPKPGEFRYLRLAWKTAGGGVMLELAADARWPDARDQRRRYFAGKNSTRWEACELSPNAPSEWRVVTLDLWKDNGSFTLTGLAPTAMGGTACFDRIELWRDLSVMDRADR